MRRFKPQLSTNSNLVTKVELLKRFVENNTGPQLVIINKSCSRILQKKLANFLNSDNVAVRVSLQLNRVASDNVAIRVSLRLNREVSQSVI